MVDYILKEMRWYHVVGLVFGLLVVLVLILWLTRGDACIPWRGHHREVAE